jgi:hypothetical protein
MACLLSQSQQLFGLFVLALPVAAIAWTFTHEEVFREVREFCAKQSRTRAHLYQRKFFYMLTCEYCFSHYVTILLLIVTRFKMLYPDWRGYLVGGFAIVWVANIYLTVFGRIRLEIKHERIEIAASEFKVQKKSDRSKQSSGKAA